jgi:hypothetical protein
MQPFAHIIRHNHAQQRQTPACIQIARDFESITEFSDNHFLLERLFGFRVSGNERIALAPFIGLILRGLFVFSPSRPQKITCENKRNQNYWKVNGIRVRDNTGEGTRAIV